MNWYEDPVYIKMADCPEIQEQRKRISLVDGKLWMFNEDGDWIANTKLVGIATRAIRSTGAIKNSPKLVWLPREDQLQILSGLSWREFDKECLEYEAETKEQAGIQVVLKRLYDKVWCEDKWVRPGVIG